MKQMGSNMQSLADHLSDRPLSIAHAARYMKSGPQYARDTLERLCERGIARRSGSERYVRA